MSRPTQSILWFCNYGFDGKNHSKSLSVVSFYVLYFQLKKQFPTMNLKIPAKRIFGDNFDPGKLLSCFLFCQCLCLRLDLLQHTGSYLR